MTQPQNSPTAGKAEPSFDDLLTVTEVSKLTGLTPASLYNYSGRRNAGTHELGPDPTKIGHALFYRREDVDAYLTSRGQ
jgi:predicted DNA-binding transcriptional regulator AlpA